MGVSKITMTETITWQSYSLGYITEQFRKQNRKYRKEKEKKNVVMTELNIYNNFFEEEHKYKH